MTPRTSKPISAEERERIKKLDRASQKRYDQSPKSKAKRRRYEHTAKRKAYKKRYAQTPIGKTIKQRKSKRFEDRQPKQRKSKAAVRSAIAQGKLPPISSMLCVKCGEPAEEYHHYLGYEPEHWLDVIPLCLKCHTKTRVDS